MVQYVVFLEGVEPGRVHELQRKKKLRASAEFSTGRHALGFLPAQPGTKPPAKAAAKAAARATRASSTPKAT